MIFIFCLASDSLSSVGFDLGDLHQTRGIKSKKISLVSDNKQKSIVSMAFVRSQIFIVIHIQKSNKHAPLKADILRENFGIRGQDIAVAKDLTPLKFLRRGLPPGAPRLFGVRNQCPFKMILKYLSNSGDFFDIGKAFQLIQRTADPLGNRIDLLLWHPGTIKLQHFILRISADFPA